MTGNGTPTLSPEKEYIVQKLTDKQVRELLELAYKVDKNQRQMQRIDKVDTFDSYAKLQNLVGLTETKAMIDKILAFTRMRALAVTRGKTMNEITNHMCFVGNPGTAKTTVARLLADIFYRTGVTRKNTFVEVGRGELVSGYVGQTALKVKSVVKKALGGVLFIDEAYGLLDDRAGNYGEEAINTLIAEMENHRHDLIVILAGYPDRMEDFLKSNPGMKSRVPYVVSFPDYTTEELFDIACVQANLQGYKLDESARSKLMEIFARVQRTDTFGNGRMARNMVEEALMNNALRFQNKDVSKLSDDELFTLIGADFHEPKPEAEDKFAHRPIGF